MDVCVPSAGSAVGTLVALGKHAFRVPEWPAPEAAVGVRTLVTACSVWFTSRLTRPAILYYFSQV